MKKYILIILALMPPLGHSSMCDEIISEITEYSAILEKDYNDFKDSAEGRGGAKFPGQKEAEHFLKVLHNAVEKYCATDSSEGFAEASESSPEHVSAELALEKLAMRVNSIK